MCVNTVMVDDEGDDEVVYNYNDFAGDLMLGHEIMFSYQDNDYSIIQSPDGWYFKNISDEAHQTYSSPQNLMDGVTINNQSLRDVFNSGEVNNVSVY
jgi:hypothetical protein